MNPQTSTDCSKMLSLIVVVSTIFSVVEANIKYTPIMIAEIFRNGGAFESLDKELVDKIFQGLPSRNQQNLVPNGIRQQYNLGKCWKEEYPEIFKGNIDLEKVSMSSAAKRFSMDSATAHLYGLLEESDIPQIEMSIEHLPSIYPPMAEKTEAHFKHMDSKAVPQGMGLVPIQTFSSEKDFMYFPELDTQCKGIAENNLYDYSQFVSNKDQFYLPTVKTLEQKGFNATELLGKKEWDLEGISKLFRVLEVYYYSQNKHYSLIDPDLFNELKILHGIHRLNYYFPNAENSKVYSNNVARDILSQLEMGVKGESVYAGYSALEHTLLAFLKNLRFLGSSCYIENYDLRVHDFKGGKCAEYPLFSSSIVIELSKMEVNGDSVKRDGPSQPLDDYYVSVFYNRQSLKLEGCPDVYCKYTQFRGVFSGLTLVDNIKARCGMGTTQAYKFYWILIGCILFTSLMIVLVTMKNRKIHNANIELSRTADGFLYERY